MQTARERKRIRKMRQNAQSTGTSITPNTKDILARALKSYEREMRASSKKKVFGRIVDESDGDERRPRHPRKRVIACITSDDEGKRLVKIRFITDRKKKIKCPRREGLLGNPLKQGKSKTATVQEAAKAPSPQIITVNGELGKVIDAPAVLCLPITVGQPSTPTGVFSVETPAVSARVEDTTENAAAPSATWLVREWYDNNADRMIWKTVSKSGRVRSYILNTGSIRHRLLDCISKMLARGPVITHTDLLTASQAWDRNTYFAENGGAPRGPLKGHVAVLRKALGMKISYVHNGIKVEQPED